jgi:integrase
VAASTQNQALSALLFFFEQVQGRQLAFVDAVRGRQRDQLPVVLSRDGVTPLLGKLGGRNLLMGQLLYGSGLRHSECLRLRVKDVLASESTLVIRDAKGAKDRVSVLPQAAREALLGQIFTTATLQMVQGKCGCPMHCPESIRMLHENSPGSMCLPRRIFW